MSQLARTIGLRSATVLVVSVIVGSGVFKKVAPMAAELGSPGWVLGCWVLAGLVSLAGALSNAEMAGMFPQSGGEYVYYQPVYGRLFAFLYGWGSFTVTKTATIAALAHVFAQSVRSLLPLPAWVSVPLIASGLIVGLSVLNYRGVQIAERVSRLLTYGMVIVMAGLVIAGFTAGTGRLTNLTTATGAMHPPTGYALVNALLVASLGAFWGYEGWNNIGFIGDEIKHPQRNLPFALIVGTLVVIGLYVSLNAMYLYVLPVDALARLGQFPDRIAAVEVVRQFGGTAGAVLVAALIVVTTFNSTNSSILLSARIFYAMARDGLFFRPAAGVHPRFQTPAVAIGLQGAWSVGLVWSGSFDQLTDRLVVTSFVFYGATALGVVWLRRTQPDRPRTYRVPGYPVVPLLFAGFCGLLVIVTSFHEPVQALTGLGLVATGLPFYAVWRRRAAAND